MNTLLHSAGADAAHVEGRRRIFRKCPIAMSFLLFFDAFFSSMRPTVVDCIQFDLQVMLFNLFAHRLVEPTTHCCLFFFLQIFSSHNNSSTRASLWLLARWLIQKATHLRTIHRLLAVLLRSSNTPHSLRNRRHFAERSKGCYSLPSPEHSVKKHLVPSLRGLCACVGVETTTTSRIAMVMTAPGAILDVRQ